MAWASVDPIEQALAIGCSKSEHHLCTQIPGMNLGKDGIWRAPLSWPAYVAYKTVWASQPVDEGPPLAEWGATAWAAVQDAYRMRSAVDASNPWVVSALRHLELTVTIPEKLFRHQRGGVDWLVSLGRAALTDPQGNGKTPVLIRSLQVLAGNRQGLPALVIAPPAALLGWQREVARWAPELSTRIVAGSALRRRDALLGEPSDVTLIGWPNVRLHTRLASYSGTAFRRCEQCGGIDPKVTTATCEVHLKELNSISWQTVIADEAHRMQDARSKQTRAVWWLAHHARYFWPVTGTPIGDNISGLWPVLHGLDARAWPAKSRYLDLYAIKQFAWHGGMEILDIRPDTAAAFHASVQPLMRRIPKEIARPGMPGVLPPVFRYPEMTPAQSRIYRQLKKESLAELKGQAIVPQNTAVLFTRMCQMASSMIEIEDGEDPLGFTKQVYELALPSSKADDLMDFLGDNPGQLIVAATSARLVALCERKLSEAKITNAKLVGGQSPETRDNAITWFRDGKIRVIMLTAGVGGEAIDGLQAADTVLFLQPQPSFLKREQIIGRADRIGQRNPVRVIYSIAPGTVEEGLFKLGQEKAERAGNVTRDADLMRWIIEGEDHADHLE
ncbi:MAG: DEAD/DEAH box helicase [Streptosporangiaceae bacterium]